MDTILLLKCKYGNYTRRIAVFSHIHSFFDLHGWTSALCLFVKIHKTAKVNSKLQQHSQHCIKIEDVW